MNTAVLHSLQSGIGNQKKFAVLIDPDKVDEHYLEKVVKLCNDANVDYIFVGGSLIVDHRSREWIQWIKSQSNIPVIIFPGSTMQINDEADAIFFLSLISGRNPELLIGQQVAAAPILKRMNIEVMSTGYILVDGGRPTTVSYITNTHPIPRDKPSIAMSTALAGEMMGMKVIYMDSGSGAQHPVSTQMIASVRKAIGLPIIVGGGINTPKQASSTCAAGADVVVIGTAIEKDPGLIFDISAAVHSIQPVH